MTPAIRAQGITVVLGGTPVLRGIDLTVAQGEVVALLGPNGSGKSTLVRSLVGVVPTAGTVELLGAPLGRGVPWERIGYVPQRTSSSTGVPVTALEVVTSGVLHGNRLRPGRAARTRAAEALDLVGLGDHGQRPVRVLSGGQQQRVLIARALVRRPDLLLLDEPVAGVDLPSQDAFATVLGDLGAAGTTVVVVLHELGAFASLIGRSVVLRRGRVVHDGAPPVPAHDHRGRTHDHVHPQHGAREDADVVPAPRMHP